MIPARFHSTTEVEIIMKRSIFQPTFPVAALAISVAGICTIASANLQVQVGRYTLFAATPTEAQVELLATTTTVRFPERIRTVGEAVRYLLQRSGYRLPTAESIGPDTVALFGLPLPAVHRSLGPMTLRDALATLAGSAFYLVQDPVHRLITFERCAPNRSAVQDTGTTSETEVTSDEE
ncbi:MAG: pili assembly chaperone [Gammaproteobacteria bacterium]|nr:pili assembly chaperone [Gammaproteobacteria bacterium]